MSAWSPLRRTVASGFAQLGLPLGESTTLSLGSRTDHVSDVGTLSSPQLAFEWRPLKTFKVYASTGRTVRAASLPELFQPASTIQTSALDLVRQQVNKVDVVVGGNSALQPVKARTFASGFLLKHDSIWQGTLGLKYWHIQLDDRITVPAITYLLGHERLYHERIQRAPATEEDIAAGRPGTLQLVDMTMNGGPLDTSGVDLEASLAWPSSFGQLSADLNITYFDKYASTEMRGLPASSGLASRVPTEQFLAYTQSTHDRTGAPAAGTTAATASGIAGHLCRMLTSSPPAGGVPSQTLVDLKFVTHLDQLVGGVPALEGWRLTLRHRELARRSAPLRRGRHGRRL